MPVQTIDPAALARLVEAKPNLDLIDVRTPAEYETVHARGAHLSPLDRLEPRQVMQSRRGPADEPLYIICKSGARSAKACEKFISDGFTNVISVAGGTEAWAAAGLPVERKGRNVLPLDRQMQLTAGLICLTGAILGYALSPWFYAFSAMVGAGLTTAGLTGFCPLMLVLSRMPWNTGRACNSCCSPSSH